MKPMHPTSYFFDPFGDDKWIAVPDHLTDEQTREMADSLGLKINEIERIRYPQPVAFFNGTSQQWQALYDVFKEWDSRSRG